jgi:hypothetical protein
MPALSFLMTRAKRAPRQIGAEVLEMSPKTGKSIEFLSNSLARALPKKPIGGTNRAILQTRSGLGSTGCGYFLLLKPFSIERLTQCTPFTPRLAPPHKHALCPQDLECQKAIQDTASPAFSSTLSDAETSPRP